MGKSLGNVGARREAEKLLKKYQIDSAPINVEDLARREECTLVLFDGQDGVSGMLKRTGDKTIIAVNSSHPETRKRFTIAHEIGHLICHQDRNIFVDQSKRVNFRNGRSSLAIDQEEMEANAFAATLLMPKALIKQEANALLSEGAITQVDELIENLAGTFQVSSQSMEYRLKNLGIIDTDFELFG